MVQKLVQKSDLNTSTFKNVGVRYIYQFRGTYYFRYVVPKAHRNLILGAPKQFKLSLHTSSYTLAIERVAPLWRCVEAVKSSLAPDQVTVHYKKLVSELERLRYSARTSPDSSYPLLKDSWYSLLKSKNWKEKRLSTANQMFRNIEFYLGNKPVNQYSVRDLQDCLKRIATLPVRNKFPYRSMQLEEVLHLKNVPVEDYVSDKTVKEHLKLLVMLFTSYLCEEMKVLVESPAQGLKVTVKESRFGAFTDKQIKSILVTMESKPDWFKWFLLFGIYSGARRSELAKLKKSDIGFDAETDSYFFKVREGKTRASERVRRLPVKRTVRY